MTTSYTLSELGIMIRDVLARGLGADHWVKAEIGDLKVHGRGHCYLELVEKDEHLVKAKMRATIWASTYSFLAPYFEEQTGTSLAGGIKVLCKVRVSFHEVYGLSLNILEIDPSYTLGERARRKREIIERIKKEGLFDNNKRIPFPLVALRIAVISSEQAAGYGDFVNQLKNNRYDYAFNIQLFSSPLQGDEAGSKIADVIRTVHDNRSDFDVIAIIRGGGSQLDLDAFDSYELALGIASSELPVITGIGHERDESVADLMAAVRLKTPTAAAEFLTMKCMEFEEGLLRTRENIKLHSRQYITSSYSTLEIRKQRIRSGAQRSIDRQLNTLKQLETQFSFRLKNRFILEDHRLNMALNKLDNHDPIQILDKGYTLSTVGGIPLNKLEDISEGSELETLSSGFTLKSKISTVIKSDGK